MIESFGLYKAPLPGDLSGRGQTAEGRLSRSEPVCRALVSCSGSRELPSYA